VQALAKSLEPRSFRIDGDCILRTLSAVCGKSVKKKGILALRDLPRPELRENLTATRKALERAIDFLRAEVGVVSSDFLPYEAQLTVLGKIFSLRKDPLTPEQRAAPRGWFWLSSFQERYRGASDSDLDGDIERCQPFLGGSGALLPLRKVDENDLKGKEFRKGTAITHAYIALLATCHPQGLWDGAPIDVEGLLAWENQREFHHIFPKGYLATSSEELRNRHSDIANIMLLPSGSNKQISSERPSVYMARLKEQHGPAALDGILASNLIPPLEDSGLLLDDFEYFLAVRLELIVKRINEFTRGAAEHVVPVDGAGRL
jgi:hypothetical protein